MPATDDPQFDVDQFDSPTPEMPDVLRQAMEFHGMVAFRALTDDGRVAWVPVSPEVLDGVRGVETGIRTMLADALRDLERDA